MPPFLTSVRLCLAAFLVAACGRKPAPDPVPLPPAKPPTASSAPPAVPVPAPRAKTDGFRVAGPQDGPVAPDGHLSPPPVLPTGQAPEPLPDPVEAQGSFRSVRQKLAECIAMRRANDMADDPRAAHEASEGLEACRKFHAEGRPLAAFAAFGKIEPALERLSLRTLLGLQEGLEALFPAATPRGGFTQASESETPAAAIPVAGGIGLLPSTIPAMPTTAAVNNLPPEPAKAPSGSSPLP